MMNASRTVFVVDDDDSVRRALALLLDSVGMKVVEYGSAEAFLTGYDPEDPGCLVLDVRMPNMSGLDLQKELRARSLEIPIVFITGHGDVPMSVQAMKKGAIDFLLKPFNDQQLLDAVHKALYTDSRLRGRRARRIEARTLLDTLTPREREVFALVVEGSTNKEIGNILGAAEPTIKIHRGRVMHKLQAESVPDLVHLAQDAGDPTGEEQ
jgi:two-component system response regulator FixJ